MSIEMLRGKTLTRIVGMEADSDIVMFTDGEGREYRMDHDKDCCEVVYLVEVIGDPADLIGSPIIEAEEVCSEGAPPPEPTEGLWDDRPRRMWTFYKLGTRKGHVTLRWFGASNGYYAVDVTFEALAH